MKKLFALLLVAIMVFTMVACGNKEDDKMKVGFIFLHDEQSTYDKNFIDAAVEACEKMGVKMVQKTQIPESQKCYDAAVELIETEGCEIIFADSFGHESFLIEAAKKYPDVQFCHATGTQAHTAGVKNFHNAFASIYQGRYAAGVVAGLKLNEMIADGKITAEQAKMGYVGAFTFAEVISGYTSFYLGVKYMCPTATMDVQFTGSWYDELEEKNAANALMDRNCVLISQHADSMGAPTACEERQVPNISYNGSTLASCPNTFIVSSKIDWTPYFVLICQAVMNGTEIPVDYTGTISTGSVALTDVNGQAAAAGTQDKINEIKAQLVAGELHVFDTSFFTVGNETLTTYMADVDTDAAYEGDTEVIIDGYFHESEFRSAPYFNVRIDGITLVNEKY